MNDTLVTPEWLEARLSEPNIVVLDCTWFVPEKNISGRALFREGHIPGAQFVDLEDISDPASPFINMMPPKEVFAQAIGSLGIDNETLVILYNSNYVSARLWWMFRHFGHRHVRILNGGFQRWRNEGRPVESGDARSAASSRFAITDTASDIVNTDQVLAAAGDGSATIVDVRPEATYRGTQPTGYPGVAPGHIPNSVNLPWSRLLAGNDEKHFVSPDEFRTLLDQAGIDLSRPIIATCGSGITACILAFHLERIGHTDWTIYDGSWNEWGQLPDTPKRTAAEAFE